MRRSDAVLVVLLVAALAVTGVGVAKSDDWTGERTYRFASAQRPLEQQDGVPAGAAPARLEWAAPDNATGVQLDMLVDFAGQSVQGGAATIRVSGTAPDGSQLPVQTRTLAIAPGATSAQASFGYNATWLEPRSTVRDTQEPPAVRWEQPLVVLVSVDRPGDTPVSNYAFTVSATGAFTLAVVR